MLDTTENGHSSVRVSSGKEASVRTSPLTLFLVFDLYS